MLVTGRRRATLAVLAILLVVAGAVAVYLNATRREASAAAAASLTIFTGTANVKHSADATSTGAATGDQLHNGDVVTTGPSTKAAITFPGGSITRLDSNTTLAISGLAQAAAGGWTVALDQSAGKTWHSVGQLVGGSRFTVGAQNHATAEVRGTEFEVIVEQRTDGTVSIRFNNFSGSIDVSGGTGPAVTVPAGDSTTVNAGAPPTPPAPISNTDRQDSFTVFNQTFDTTRGSPASFQTAAAPLPQGGSFGVAAGAPSDGNTDLDFALGWPGSCFTLQVYAPDGTLYQETNSCTPPIHLVVPRGRAGTWSYRVLNTQSDAPEVWWVIISKTTPATQAPVPFFTGGACSHSLQAPGSDSWTVGARSAAGVPTLTATGLPAGATIRDNGDGSATIVYTAGADATTQDASFGVVASIAGTQATLQCTEQVRAAPRDSSISGRVAGAGAGVLLTLSPGGSTTTTAADGTYAFIRLGAGTYTVTLSLPPAALADTATSRTVVLDGTGAATVNFGFHATPAAVTPTPTPTPTPTVSSTPTPAPAIATASPAAATYGGRYAYQETATGGTGPYTWQKTSGTLPGGITLSSGGVLSGSPDRTATPAARTATPATTAGPATYTFTLVATDANKQASAPVTQTITVNPEPTITFAPVYPPVPSVYHPPALDGAAGQPAQTGSAPASGFVILAPVADMTVPYSQQFGVAGGTAPYAWSISSGDPSPWGLHLSASGLLSGTPTSAVDGGAIQVRVTDATGAYADGEVDINIFKAPTYVHQVTPFSAGGLASADAGTSFSAGLGFGEGAAGPGQLSVSQGALPACLHIYSGEGFQISGYLTPACVGTFTFTIRLTDLMGGFADSIPLTLRVYPPVDLGTTPAPPPGALNVAYPAGWTVAAQSGYAPNGYTYVFYGLPPGLLYGVNGLTGTPTASGDFPLHIQVQDAGGVSYFDQFTVHIAGPPPPLTIGGGPTYYVDVRQAYTGSYIASGGVPPYTYSTSSLAPGMTFDPMTATFGGTAMTAGSYTVSGQVCDSSVASVPNCAPTSTVIGVYALPTIAASPPVAARGTVGQPYTGPGGFQLTGGAGCCGGYPTNLPAGMYAYHSSSGAVVFSGTPSFAGNYIISDTETDRTGASTGTATTTLVIMPAPPPTLTTNPIRPAGVGQDYQLACGYACDAVTISGGNPFDTNNPANPSAFSIQVVPAAPAGMAFETRGWAVALSGTPTAASPLQTYTVTVTDSANQTAVGSFQFQVGAAPTLRAMPPGWDAGRPYTNPDGSPVTLASGTGTAPITWALSGRNCSGCRGHFGGSLPPGVTLAADGTLSGTPTAPGTYAFQVQATDSLNVLAFIDVQIAIADPTLTITAPPDPTAGRPYAGSFAVTGGTHPYTLQVTPVSPFAGLLPDRFGNLTGTPTGAPGTAATYTVTATDLAGSTASVTFTMHLAAPAAVHAASPAALAAPAPAPAPTRAPAPAPTRAPAPPSASAPAPAPALASAPRTR